MSAFLGSPPKGLLQRGRATNKYFSPKGIVCIQVSIDILKFCVTNSKAGLLLSSNISPRSNLSLGDTITVLEGEDKQKFLKFVGRMLTWLPEDRATAKELLSDPWLKC